MKLLDSTMLAVFAASLSGIMAGVSNSDASPLFVAAIIGTITFTIFATTKA